MLARAHELGLRVMIDLVLSHTSDQHRWFSESRQSRDNARVECWLAAQRRHKSSKLRSGPCPYGTQAEEAELLF